MAISAPHARSSAIWLIAPAVAAPSRAAKRVPRWNSQTTPAVQARHHHGAEQRVGAELMNAQVPIPARESHDAVDVGRQGPENRGGAEGKGLRPVRPGGRGGERAADDDVGQGIHGRRLGTRGDFTGGRIPVPVEVVPALGARTDAGAQLVREVLRGSLDRFVAGSFRSTKIGTPARTLKRPGRRRSMKHGSRGAPVMNAIRAGVLRNEARRPRHLDLDTIAADMAVHEHGDDAVCRETAADLKGRLERLTDLDRVGADRRANFVTQPVDSGVVFGHGDDGERYLHDSPDEDRADFPVSVMAAHENETPPVLQQIENQSANQQTNGRRASRGRRPERAGIE